jgi:hypothetical protein
MKLLIVCAMKMFILNYVKIIKVRYIPLVPLTRTKGAAKPSNRDCTEIEYRFDRA